MNPKIVKPGLLFFLFVLGCHQDKVAPLTGALPDQVVCEFTLDESMSGKRLYTLQAVKAVVWDDDLRIDVDSLKVIFYNDSGFPYSELTAAQGTVFTRTENLVARGNVVVITTDSTELVTDSLAWDNSRRIIHTQANILINTPKGSLCGSGLISDPSLSKIQILSEVRGTSNYEFQP
ncbi:MAG: LPS export ABC transporter periplasmic protein LptC [bacterium]